MKEKMRPAFQKVEGGLFSTVSKADVGDQYGTLEARGMTMLGWADPFYPDPSTPAFVIDAATEILKAGKTSHYTMPIGNAELKEEIGKYWEKNTKHHLQPQRNIIITPGSDSGLLYAMMPFINSGDEVSVPSPSYPSNFQNPELLGGVTVPVPTREEAGYHLDIEEFEKRITSKTKMVLLTNPNNPTGTVYTEEKLTALARLIVDHELVCVCDQACGRHPVGQQEVHEYEALGGGSGRRLYCRLTSFSQSLQPNLRITLDGTSVKHSLPQIFHPEKPFKNGEQRAGHVAKLGNIHFV